MEKLIQMSAEGVLKLEQELEQLKTVTRKEISEKIKTARSFGDLSENSEYDEAKNEQAMVEARITQIEQTLKNVAIIDETAVNTTTITIGSTVTVVEGKEKIEYHIVGSAEANPLEGFISDESPVGAALIGHKKGETVMVESQSGSYKLKIDKISK
jgi:transcription elongation factor GreA